MINWNERIVCVKLLQVSLANFHLKFPKNLAKTKPINNESVPRWNVKTFSKHNTFAYFYLMIRTTTNNNNKRLNAERQMQNRLKTKENIYNTMLKKHFQRKTSLKFDKFIFLPRLTLYWEFSFQEHSWNISFCIHW